VAAFRDCRIEVPAWGDTPDFACDDAEVRLEPEGCLIHYHDDEGPVVLVGRPLEAGGFELTCRSRPRRGRLALASGCPSARPGARLEGEFEELGAGGGFSIVLGEAVGSR